MCCRLFLVVLCLFAGLQVIAQNTTYNKKGDAFMKKGNYAKSAQFYKKAADANMNDVSAKEKLGKALLEMGDVQSAEAVYRLLANSPMAADINKFYYAQILRMSGKYEVAGLAYKSYFDEHPNDPLAADFKDFTERVQPLMIDHKVYQLTNIPENSAGSDEGPTFCLYDFCFTSNGHSSSKGTYDLYMLHGGNKANPASPQPIKGNVNQSLDEGAATFTGNGREMIFTRSNYHHKGSDKNMKLGLYHADYDTSALRWTNITPMSFISFDANYMQPSLSKDGSMLFFASDMKGGFGETDIYLSRRQNGTWSTPVNLGKTINTIGKEETPYIADDGTLYFSSDSRFGLGGLDIYAASRMDTTWGHPINPGAPLNSVSNDFGYMSDSMGRSGYLVSNRAGGMGGNDIYHFTMANSSTCGILADAKNQKMIEGASITLVTNEGTQLETKSNSGGDFCFDKGGEGQLEVNKAGYERYHGIISSASGARQFIMLHPKGSIEFEVSVSQTGGNALQGANATLTNTITGESSESKTDSDGRLKFAIEPNQEYVLKVSKNDIKRGEFEKFVRPISTLGLKAGHTIKEDAQLIYHEDKSAPVTNTNAEGRPLNNNYEGALPIVYFDKGSYELNAKAKKELNKIVGYMKTAPDAEVGISSNTDATGNMKANMVLSARRALVCLNYLVTQGIEKNRFIAVGFGDKHPVSTCAKPEQCTETELAMNRRTEFKVIKR